MTTDALTLTYRCQLCLRRNFAVNDLDEDTSCPVCGGTCVVDKRPPFPSREKLESRRTFAPADLLGGADAASPLTPAELATLSEDEWRFLATVDFDFGARVGGPYTPYLMPGHREAFRAILDLARTRARLAEAESELAAVRIAVAPVTDWYVYEDHPLRIDEIVTGAIEDLQVDRETSLRHEAQLRQVDDALSVLHIAATDGDYKAALRQMVEAELAIAGYFDGQDAEKIAALEAELATERELTRSADAFRLAISKALAGKLGAGEPADMLAHQVRALGAENARLKDALTQHGTACADVAREWEMGGSWEQIGTARKIARAIEMRTEGIVLKLAGTALAEGGK